VAGPAQQSTNTIVIPPGEGRRTYSPVALAWYIENLETEGKDVLKSVVGPTTLRIGEYANFPRNSPLLTVTSTLGSTSVATFDSFNFDYEGSSASGTTVTLPTGFPSIGWAAHRPHSIFSAPLLNGSANTLLYRFGNKLLRFNGGIDAPSEVLDSTLTTTSHPRFPDQYVVINDKVVWTNGEDRARIINYDGSIFKLGFDQGPTTPLVNGPTQPDFDEVPQYYPNALGYSWPGRIGTPGDVLTGRVGALLSGRWYYYLQLEDIFGNLSPFSSVSEPGSIKSNQAQPFKTVAIGSEHITFQSAEAADKGNREEVKDGTEIDDLTRRFLLSVNLDAPEHTVAVRIYRTPDTEHVDATPRFLSRIPGSKSFLYDDNNADSDLGTPWTEIAPVPTFRVACSHQGRLIVGNIPGDPGIVRRSEPGFPGTFVKSDFIYPDAGGAEITGLVSHNGVLIAFTETSMYAIADDFAVPQPLSLGIGCVAPRSIAARDDGTLFWLGQDGFYGMKALGDIIRMSSPIDAVFKLDVNKSMTHMAVAAIDPESTEYRCALAPAGSNDNLLMFCYDGQYWRRQTLGIHIADMTSSDDWRDHVYAIGADPRERRITINYDGTNSGEVTRDLSRVFVLNRQTTDYFGPPRRIRYRSGWMMSAESGLIPLNVRSLYVGLKDAWNGRATVRIFKNNSWKPVQEMTDLLLVGVDDGSDLIRDIAGSAKLDKARLHEPRLFWRQIPVDLHNVNSWAFEIELIGFPGPLEGKFSPNWASAAAPSFDKINPHSPMILGKENLDYRNLVEFKKLFINGYTATQEKNRVIRSASNYELGRLRIAAFAFDTSVATQGSPLGRVPDRQDK
jgi:hypothetical protein